MKQKHRFVKYFVIVIIICVLVFGVDLVLSQKYISITSYICENNKIKQNFKIVHLTDLHNYQFGSKNQRLISKVKTEAPDRSSSPEIC